MEKNNQSQRAGSHSQQVQIENVVINQGITEERARNVFMEMIPQALEIYTQEAYATANMRISKFEESVIPRIANIEGALSLFADPAFQILLRKAQQSAAATERENDYALLSELLVCHVEKGNNRKNRIAISKAIDIVDDIDDDALCALTLAHAVNQYFPISGDIESGFNILSGLFSKLLYIAPPKKMEWLEHLEVLGAVRLAQFGNLKRFVEYYPKQLAGYACIGLKVDSEEYQEAISILRIAKLDPSILVPNILLDGYVRLPVTSKDSIKDLGIINAVTTRGININEKKALEKIWEMYTIDDTLQQKVNTEFINLWDSFEPLKTLRTWWESIPTAFSITKVGTILAHTNAKRCDSTLPDLI